MPTLTDILRRKIADEGPISIADYMGLCLGHPEHGYYSKQDPFGARGDFITAPEISQIFGEMIGVWAAEVWRQMEGGPINLVELGPGRGTLMADLLRATKRVPDFHESLTIHMVETSPVLANAQYMRLRDEHPRIEWLDSIDQLPEERMIVVANEFFDALPIKQFLMTEDGLRERRIDWDKKAGEFVFTTGPLGLQLAKSGQVIAKDTVMEQSPESRRIMRQLATQLREHGGAALIIDYGYLGEAHHNTLQAAKAHAYHSVLKDPGDADLTAHVDFTTLMHIAHDVGGEVFGPVDQRDFLIRIGAQVRGDMLMKQAMPEQQELIKSGLHRLLAKEEMGELFKVMAVMGDARIEPPGFMN